MKRRAQLALLLVPLACVYAIHAQVASDRLLRAADEPQNWLTYSGTYFSQRYSQLRQIDAANIKNLEMKWVFQAQSLQTFSATPLVVDGVMYLTQAPNDVVALDAKTGRMFWIYRYSPSPGRLCCRGLVNRGVAIQEAWRFYTIPGPGEPGNETWGHNSWEHGGAPAWLTGSYDAALNLIYWGTGNPGPDFNATQRPGDNLYSDSVVATPEN